MKEKLIELMYKEFKELTMDGDWKFTEMLGGVADYLLANGVIVPPCKIGDLLYQTVLIKKSTGFITERKVVGFHLGDFPKARGEVQRKQYFIIYNQDTNSVTHIDFKELDKTVFLTKEEAEQALKEMVTDKSSQL